MSICLGNTTETGELYLAVYSDYWAQTFKPSISHTLTSIKLKGYRHGTIGDVTITVRTTSGGDPTATVLSTGTYNGSLLPASENGVPPGGSSWFETSMTSYNLVAGTTYAISVYCVASGVNYLSIKSNTGNLYADGGLFYSTDGSSWDDTGHETNDMLFEECYNAVAFGNLAAKYMLLD